MGEQEFEFSLTANEANVILGALGKMQYADVYMIVAKMQHQFASQVQKPESEGSGQAELPL